MRDLQGTNLNSSPLPRRRLPLPTIEIDDAPCGHTAPQRGAARAERPLWHHSIPMRLLAPVIAACALAQVAAIRAEQDSRSIALHIEVRPSRALARTERLAQWLACAALTQPFSQAWHGMTYLVTNPMTLSRMASLDGCHPRAHARPRCDLQVEAGTEQCFYEVRSPWYATLT